MSWPTCGRCYLPLPRWHRCQYQGASSTCRCKGHPYLGQRERRVVAEAVGIVDRRPLWRRAAEAHGRQVDA